MTAPEFPSVTVRLGERSEELHHGDIIGRLPSARLVIEDPRISEAHALVSLRRGHLHLLSLRRRVLVGGKPVSSVRLRERMRIELAAGMDLCVESLKRPKRIMVLETEDGRTRILAPVTSVYCDARLADHFRGDADAYVWQSAQGEWLWRLAGEETARPVDDEFELEGQRYRIRTVASHHASAPSTQGNPSAEALHIITRFDVVEFHSVGRRPVSVSGMGARLISELAAYKAPVEWTLVADALWPDLGSSTERRRRWDMALLRLRRKLGQIGVRSDLVQPDGTGLIRMCLAPSDTIDDQS